MKTYYLSSPSERKAGIAFSAVMVLCFGVLLYALRGDLLMLLVTAAAALLLTALLGFYVMSVLKGVCVVDPQAKTLEDRGFAGRTLDLSQAVMVQTLPRRSGHAMVRVLVFSDEQEQVIGVVPTLFTYKQGVLAEPLARSIAEDLGIQFKENVPVWEYDKEKFKEHQQQVALEEKADRQAKRKARMDKLLHNPRKKK